MQEAKSNAQHRCDYESELKVTKISSVDSLEGGPDE